MQATPSDHAKGNRRADLRDERDSPADLSSPVDPGPRMSDTESALTDRIAPKFFSYRSEDVTPDRGLILELQGVPVDHRLSKLSEELIGQAIREAVELARPRAVCRELDPDLFSSVLEGEGLNASPNPVHTAADRARRSLLFALTLGEEISRRIESLFGDGDPALGYTLDSAASVMAEQVADRLQGTFEEELSREKKSPADAVMRYSPGYCGWHLSGQRSLFAFLKPSAIGISINDSCLMNPIKSISGVMLAGEPSIHYFKNDFAFCEECRTKTCRERIRELSRKVRNYP